MALTSVSGDGELASSSTHAQLTVQHNDDPVNLRDSVLEASEGDVVRLVVVRGGHASGKLALFFLWSVCNDMLWNTLGKRKDTTIVVCLFNRHCGSVIPSDLHICFS